MINKLNILIIAEAVYGIFDLIKKMYYMKL